MKPEKEPLPITKCWLFAVASPKDLARRLSTRHCTVSVDDLRQLAGGADNYRVFQHRAAKREVQEPKKKLQWVHKRIHNLLSRVAAPDYLHSAIKGRSYLSNARKHGVSTPTVKIDVRKFFQSVPRVAVFGFFKDTMSCRSDVAGLLADLLTFDRHLPTGSSASPIVSYYASKNMFDEIFEFSEQAGVRMTCYVDDMTFSGTGATKMFLLQIRKVVAKHGLKSHKARHFKTGEPRVVTGVCLAKDGERVPNKLHLKIKKGFDALRASSTPEEHSKVAKTLLGRMEAARQIDKKFGERAKTLRSQLRTQTTSG